MQAVLRGKLTGSGFDLARSALYLPSACSASSDFIVMVVINRRDDRSVSKSHSDSYNRFLINKQTNK